MESIIKVVHESSQRIRFFKDFNSFFDCFFKAFPPHVYHWENPILHFDIDLKSSSTLFNVENDVFTLSLEFVYDKDCCSSSQC